MLNGLSVVLRVENTVLCMWLDAGWALLGGIVRWCLWVWFVMTCMFQLPVRNLGWLLVS